MSAFKRRLNCVQAGSCRRPAAGRRAAATAVRCTCGARRFHMDLTGSQPTGGLLRTPARVLPASAGCASAWRLAQGAPAPVRQRTSFCPACTSPLCSSSAPPMHVPRVRLKPRVRAPHPTWAPATVTRGGAPRAAATPRARRSPPAAAPCCPPAACNSQIVRSRARVCARAPGGTTCPTGRCARARARSRAQPQLPNLPPAPAAGRAAAIHAVAPQGRPQAPSRGLLLRGGCGAPGRADMRAAGGAPQRAPPARPPQDTVLMC